MKYILFILFPISAYASDTLRYDISNLWQWTDNEKTVTFFIPDSENDVLVISNRNLFSVFVNKQLVVTETRKIKWSINEVRKNFGTPVHLTITSENKLGGLSTILVSTTKPKYLRPVNNSAGLITIVWLTLLTGFIALLKIWPQTIRAYFNIQQVFSVRNTAESLVSIRTTAFNNIFVYVFLSLLVVGNLVAFQLIEPTLTAQMKWLVILFLMLMLKIVLVNFLARVFKISEFASVQFYNFIRLLVVFFSASSVFLLCFFMIDEKAIEWRWYFMIVFLVTLLLFQMVTAVKLFKRSSYTAFHLFSYLCFSEIIPATVLLKLFFVSLI